MEHKQSLEHSSLPLLSLLRDQDRYGYEMISELERRSDHTFQMKEGTLYPVLKKLEAGARDIYKEYISYCHYKGRKVRSMERRRKMEFLLLYEK